MSRCEWAACDQPATEQIDGWWMCPEHVSEHHSLAKPEVVRQPRKPRRPVVLRQLRPCGTRSAAARHRTLGEALCEPCRDAEAEYYRQAYLRRKSAA